MLPERIAPILERIRRFTATDREAKALCREGIATFLKGVSLGKRKEEILDLAAGSAVYDHRDARGRNAIDLFLEKMGPELSEEERRAIAEISGARCGTFEVVSCDPGSGLVARRVGGDEEFDIVETQASKTLKPGGLFFCRLAPYRGRHEMIPPLLPFSEEMGYVARRFARQGGPEFTAQLEDPRIWLAAHQAHRRARSLFEARMLLATELPRLAENLTLEDVEERAARMARSGSFRDLTEGISLRSKTLESLQRYTDLAIDLYNWTPQEILGGRAPAEVAREMPDQDLREALAQDLQAYSMTRASEWMGLPDEERRLALARIYREWESTRQEELEGRAPAEIISTPPRAGPWPPEFDWPLADRPLWSRARILAKLADPRVSVRTWAVQRLEYVCDAEVESRIADLLCDPDPRVRLYARNWARRWGTPAMAGATLAVLEGVEKDEAWSAAGLAVRCAPEKAVPILAKRMEDEQDAGEVFGFCMLLGGSGTPEAFRLLRETARNPSPSRRLAAAAGLLGFAGEGIALALETLADLCAEEAAGRRAWEREGKGGAALWTGLRTALELIPVHWVERHLDAFSSARFAEILTSHRVCTRDDRVPRGPDPRRFRALLRTEEYGRIRRAWNKRELPAETIAELANAIDAAIGASDGRGTIGFEVLAGRLAAFATALRAHASRLASMPPVAIRPFVAHAVAALLKACHGRLFSAELEARRGSLDDLIELADVDLPFLDEDLPKEIARFGEEAAGEVIARVERGGEDFGTVKAIETIGHLASDPAFDRDRAAAAVTSLARSDWDYLSSAFDRVLPRLGDPVLHRLPVESPGTGHHEEWAFAHFASEIGTERALYFVRHFLPRLRAVVEPMELAESLLAFAHPSVIPVLEDLAHRGKEGDAAREALATVRDILESGGPE